MEFKYPILIVGQGLAGTVLSSYLYKNDVPFRIIDNSHYAAATHAAAGLINPVTGRSYVKSWMIDELIPEARRVYSYLSDLLDINIVSERSILRALHNPAQLNKWHSSTSRDGYESYIGGESLSSAYRSIVQQPLKYGMIDNALQVDISQLILAYRQFLLSNNLLIEEDFDFLKMEFGVHKVIYANIEYSKVIFCEGWQAIKNPYFQKLPFEPAKGEALSIEIESLDTADILRDDIFIVPLSDNKCWSGGSYIWEYEDHLPTTQWKEEWKSKLDSLLIVPYKILDHKAGIRPSVKGRRPLIGYHRDHPELYIFNGLGTKGTSLAPYWARHLVESHLIEGKDIHDDININRFDY